MPKTHGAGVVTIAPNTSSNTYPPLFGGSFEAVGSAITTNHNGLAVASATFPTTYAYNGAFNVASAGNGWGMAAVALKTVARSPKIVQSTTVATTSNTSGAATVAFPANVTAGNCLVVIYFTEAWNGFGTTYTCADTLSSSYAHTISGANNPNIWVMPNCSGGANTVTITVGGSGLWAGGEGQSLVVMEVSGIVTSSPVDVNYSNQINGNGTISPSFTTTQAGDFVLISAGTAYSQNATITYQNIDLSTASMTLNKNQGVAVSSDGFGYYTQRGLAAPVTTQSVVTGSRAFGTVYQNTSGRPMFVSVTALATASGGNIQCYADASATPTTLVGGVSLSTSGTNYFAPPAFIVLPGNYYKVTNSGTASVGIWTEWY